VVSVAVWGRKSTARKALKYARKNDLSVAYLEDGWVRSSSAQAHDRKSYSLLIDTIGVYYDARTPSQFECLLNLPDDEFAQQCSATDLAYARRCRQALVSNEITKYNYCRRAELPPHDRDIVLVIDQTLDDASVRLGGMNAKKFRAMLTAAIEENPGADITMRTHPDVVAGRRKGYLTKLADEFGVLISAAGDNPIPWLQRAKRVYVGSSQLGYEALLCNTPVSVFGQPFYAGWGLTDDREPVDRRKQQRSVDELFHIAHIKLARYVNPVSGKPWHLHECIEHVQLQRYWFDRNAKPFRCVGITPWKRGYIEQYLRSPDGSVAFKGSASHDVIATWGFRHFEKLAPRSSAGLVQPIVRIEDGFLRSAGLGSNFTAPGSLVVDSRGLYFDPKNVSDLEHLLNSCDCSPSDIQRAMRLRRRILGAGLSKYNVGDKSQSFAPATRQQRVLVVGQVEDDASVQRGCLSSINNNSALLEAVRRTRPDAYVVYKPHPDVVAGNRSGAVADPLQWVDEVNTDSSIASGLEWCNELHTMTSLAGFEALLREKHVVTYGLPFYAGWGLTDDAEVCERRVRRRTLDELVFMTLIAYPRYVDIDSGEFIAPETMVAQLEQQGLMFSQSPTWMQRQKTKAANILKGCWYAP